VRLANHRDRAASSRLNETSDQKMTKRTLNRIGKQTALANEEEIQRQHRQREDMISHHRPRIIKIPAAAQVRL